MKLEIIVKIYIYEDVITNSMEEAVETDFMPAEDIITEDNAEGTEIHEFTPVEN